MSWQCEVNGISTANSLAKMFEFLTSSTGFQGCDALVTPNTCQGSSEPDGKVTFTALMVSGVPYCVLLHAILGDAPLKS
jgi:hypothetical protein